MDKGFAMKRRRKGPKLSAAMREAVAIAKANDGHLNRYTGGVWNGPAGNHPGVPTNTVRALVVRGVFKWGRHESSAAGSFPVDAILCGTGQAELFPPTTPLDDQRHREARFLLVSHGWTCTGLVQDGRCNRIERWSSPDARLSVLVDFYSGGDGVEYYWQAPACSPEMLLALVHQYTTINIPLL